MTHPTREQWMSFLHDETNGAEGRALQQHLGNCAECRAQVTVWQETRRQLDTWKLAPPQSRGAGWLVWPRLAAAAAAAVVLLAAGLTVGRATAPSRADLATLRAEIEGLKGNLASRVESAVQAETQRQMHEFAVAFDTRLQSVAAQHVNDLVALRRELETVAVLTEAGFNQTASRFVQLVGANPAGKPEEINQ